jgi:Transposase IS116/IS110/IS902 family
MVSFSVGVLTKIVVPYMYKALLIHKIRQNTKIPTLFKTLYLAMNGTSISYAGTTFTKGHIEKLKELNDYRINGYLRIIESLNDEINAVSKKILLLAQENEMAKLLMTIPGIGYYSALLIVSEVGDINRFPDSYHLCSYAGLIPSTHSSGGITYHGSVTKTGSKYLRWIMLECLHAHIRNDKNSNVTQFYHRISKKKGNSKAAVAAASKLLKVAKPWLLIDEEGLRGKYQYGKEPPPGDQYSKDFESFEGTPYGQKGSYGGDFDQNIPVAEVVLRIIIQK